VKLSRSDRDSLSGLRCKAVDAVTLRPLWAGSSGLMCPRWPTQWSY